ncbi:delta(3,5)-Delta(2,4)-dienoyl-CoA isomerase, mitochondrial-like [Passer montanus]|uniref:delta(3,5)-Delta(2,4)-dienoyl-CoA isomerase, mitochondrial-like n=1 Tax=Passer montanus TaxID=9160 RepID=UPI00195F82DA|nr:delta(3,5)-Delta(2,4)-dienoyl-CoA isomerase, mitochondrial-like [Passer montanus]
MTMRMTMTMTMTMTMRMRMVTKAAPPGVDLISACDIRFCSQDASFQVKEVDMGLAADVGTLQRLPKIVGSQSLVNELAFTARVMRAPEALSCGLVSRVLPDKGWIGHVEHGHAADRGHPQVGAGGPGEEGPRGRALRQALMSPECHLSATRVT